RTAAQPKSSLSYRRPALPCREKVCHSQPWPSILLSCVAHVGIAEKADLMEDVANARTNRRCHFRCSLGSVRRQRPTLRRLSFNEAAAVMSQQQAMELARRAGPARGCHRRRCGTSVSAATQIDDADAPGRVQPQ